MPDVPGILSHIAELLDSDLGQVAAATQAKLACRAQRDGLQGCGDNR
ncbi:hypothetical protein [Ornithinimicrobium murale]|nr:hypothetical protein [Ornithinimicrobium murale]